MVERLEFERIAKAYLINAVLTDLVGAFHVPTQAFRGDGWEALVIESTAEHFVVMIIDRHFKTYTARVSANERIMWRGLIRVAHSHGLDVPKLPIN